MLCAATAVELLLFECSMRSDGLGKAGLSVSHIQYAEKATQTRQKG